MFDKLVNLTVISQNSFLHLDILSPYIPMMTDFSCNSQPYLCIAHQLFNTARCSFERLQTGVSCYHFLKGGMGFVLFDWTQAAIKGYIWPPCDCSEQMLVHPLYPTSSFMFLPKVHHVCFFHVQDM